MRTNVGPHPVPNSGLPRRIQQSVKKPVWKSVASQACSKSKLKPSVSEGLNFESAHWENLFINLRTNPPILRRSASFATTNGKMSSAG